MKADDGSPPGLDLRKLGAWFAQNIPGAGSDLTASVIVGGKSNLTYIVSDGSQDWVLRRPPLGHVLVTAHDMSREYRVMSALKDTEVPVPRTFAFEGDGDVVEADFYVMERCDGTPYRAASELESVGIERTRAISTSLIDTLGALHAIDPATVGLADLGHPEGFLARQVDRWKKQLDASYSRELPVADELYGGLSATAPPESAPGIVHGDFRLDNLLFNDSDQVTAVLDWEMATLGDPLTDLALMLTYHRLAKELPQVVSSVSLAPGFLSEGEIIERYAAGSERDLSNFAFYRALAAFKLSAVLEGVHYRYIQGKTVGEGFDRIGEAIQPLLDAGLAALKEHG